MIIYTKDVEELYQHMKQNGLYRCFMMTQYKYIRIQMLCINRFQKDTFSNIYRKISKNTLRCVFNINKGDQ